MKYSHLVDTVSIKKIKETGNIGEFHIEGLYTGYGITLGNSLRRVLLNSLPGAAITKIKIKDIEHEFSTVPGLVEDVVDFTLNLKKVRFHFFADEPQVLKLQIKGEREVKAGDIESTPLVRVINEDLHLATLTKKKAELDFELTVERGLGYLSSEARRLERLPIGTIVLDAIFSPIVRVEFSVENMRVGEITNYNRLKITIETDGSITPSAALHKAGNILKDHFERISGIEVTKVEMPVEKKSLKAEKKKRAKKT